MPILKNRCPSAPLCNSSECEHKREHEKNDFCRTGCKWGASKCQSDLKGYIDSQLCYVQFSAQKGMIGGTILSDALDEIMAAVKEEYGE